MRQWSQMGLALALGIAAPAAAAQDARTQAQSGEITLEADDIINDDANKRLIAQGNVVASYEGRLMRADRVIYDLANHRVHAIGNVQIFDPDGSRRFADEIEADESLNDGYATNFSTILPTGAVAMARSAVRTANGVNALDKAIYTSCQVCEDGDGTPTWALRARRAVLDQNTQMISYQDAVLEVAGVPVFYMPYFTHPDPNSERRSGLLPPDFGTSSKLGLFYQQPYYWTLSPSSDITISPALFANARPLLAIDYRKRFWSGEIRIDASATHEREFDSDGVKFGDDTWRSHIFTEGRFAINSQWQWGFGAERMSDDLYTRRYDISGEGEKRGLYDSQPRRLLSQIYLVGQGGNFYADVAVLNFQGLRGSDDNATLPMIAPLAFAERNLDFGRLGRLSLNLSAAGLTRDTGTDSQRVSLGADWRTAQVLPGGLVLEPFAELRGDYYALDEAVSGTDSVTRTVGTLGAEMSWPMVRPGESVDVLIEPAVMAAWGVDNPNEEPIPVEDALLFEADLTSLFDGSAAPGYDLYEGGGRAALGFTATADWRGGLQARLMAGRRWRESADPAFDRLSNLDDTASDWVTGFGFSYGKTYSFDARVRLDRDDFSPTRTDLRGAIDLWRINGAVRYFRLDESINAGTAQEGIDVGAEFRITSNVSLLYKQTRDLAGTAVALRDPFTGQYLRDPITNAILFDAQPRDLRRSIGLAWGDDCSRFELAFSRSEAIDRTIGPNDKIEFRFFLKTLGGVGDRDFD